MGFVRFLSIDTHVHEDRGDSTTKHPLSGPNTAPDAEIANQKNPVVRF